MQLSQDIHSFSSARERLLPTGAVSELSAKVAPNPKGGPTLEYIELACLLYKARLRPSCRL